MILVPKTSFAKKRQRVSFCVQKILTEMKNWVSIELEKSGKNGDYFQEGSSGVGFSQDLWERRGKSWTRRFSIKKAEKITYDEDLMKCETFFAAHNAHTHTLSRTCPQALSLTCFHAHKHALSFLPSSSLSLTLTFFDTHSHAHAHIKLQRPGIIFSCSHTVPSERCILAGLRYLASISFPK